MNKERIVLPKANDTIKSRDTYAKLLDMISVIERERGFRFTEEQADIIQQMIKNLIDQIREYKHSQKH
jgi:hypothetical protein